MILMEVRLQRDPKPSIFVDFSDFGGFLSIPTLTKITKITLLEQFLYEFGNLPDFQLRSGKVAIIMGVRAATRFLDVFSAKIVDFGPKTWFSNPFRRNSYGGSAPEGSKTVHFR